VLPGRLTPLTRHRSCSTASTPTYWSSGHLAGALLGQRSYHPFTLLRERSARREPFHWSSLIWITSRP
jgi:hypothetical protein